jgi:hypothetical protein
MTADTTLHDFCFGHAGVSVVPAEAIGAHGLDAAWADAAVERQRITAAQRHCLAAGIALYWQRTRELFLRAPASWFPPRRTNLLVAAEPAAVPPYFDPFGGTSSLLYRSDLDTHPEYVAFLLAHNERVSLLGSLRAALICNLSWWLGPDAGSQNAFAEAARCATRPDARLFVQLAGAFGWIGALCHEPLRPPAPGSDQPYLHVAAADLFVPKRLQGPMSALCDAADTALHAAMQAARPRRAAASSGSLTALCGWMQQARAHLIVKGADGRELWSPESTDTAPLRAALRGAGDAAVHSLHHDFAVVHERSRSVLDALADRAALPRRSAVLEAGDGAWLDAARHAVVYELRQPGFDACADAAPPFHRLLLGARVVHEWGHLAHAGQLIRVPEERKPAYRQARAALGEVFVQVLARLPQRLQAEVAQELIDLAPRAGDRADHAAALARKTLARVGDYLANLLCARLLPADELQAYVRHNVRSHMTEGLGLAAELARYAHEVHYLALAGLPRSYFFYTTRYRDYFVDTGLVTEADTHALFDAAGRVLACYAIDECRLRLPPRADPVGGR